MKTKMLVDRMGLKRAVESVEAGGPFGNRTELYEAVANTEWAKTYKPKPVTPSVAMLRIEEFGIEVKTPKGKRGRQPGTKISDEQKAAMQAGRKDRNYDVTTRVPPGYEKLVQRVAKGSLPAAIKLKCLDCCCYELKEVKLCTVTGCPLWNFRPGRRSGSTPTALDIIMS